MRRPPLKRLARYLAAALAALTLALAGVAVGMRVAGSQVYETELGDVRIEVEPALSGEVDAYIPIADWGLRADAFRGPIRLQAELRSVDRRAVLRAAAGSREVLTNARDQLDDAAATALVRAALFGFAGAVLMGGVAFLLLRVAGRPRRHGLAAAAVVAGTGALVIVVSVLLARSTFDPDAFERPRFYARGAELLQLLDAASHSDERADRYSSKLEGTLIRLSDLLANSGVGGPPIGGPDGSRRALLGSDLHSNSLVIEPLEELAQPDGPVFLVGDFGHAGSESEARLLAPRLRRLGSRVIAVSGNHDSTALMRRLASVGVTVLTEDGQLRSDGRKAGTPVVRTAGLRVAGYSDPLEWHGDDPDDPERIFSFTEYPDEEAARAEAEADLVRWFDSLPERPDVVLVHQNGLAQHLAETVGARPGRRRLIVLTGHDHKQHVTRYDQAVVVDAGSAGAGGVLGIGDERVAVGDLHFAADSPALASVDLIEVDPFSGAALAQRVIVQGNECDEGEASCELSP